MSLLYWADAPGANPSGFFGSCRVGDYAYDQTDFTYKLTITSAVGVSTDVIHVGQVIIARREKVTGNPIDDWKIRRNTAVTTPIPDCQVTPNQIRAITGDTSPISIDPVVNQNRFQQ